MSWNERPSWPGWRGTFNSRSHRLALRFLKRRTRRRPRSEVRVLVEAPLLPTSKRLRIGGRHRALAPDGWGCPSSTAAVGVAIESAILASAIPPAERPPSALRGDRYRIVGGQTLTPLPMNLISVAATGGRRLDLEIAFGRPLSDRSALRRGPRAV